MLTALHLRDFTIAADVELQLRPGLTVITGETGAGKSLLLDALGLLVGGRASDKVVRSGAQRASLEAIFDLSHRDDVVSAARDRGVEIDDGELVVRRVIPRKGSSRAWLNGAMVSAADLRAVVAPLLDLSTQHQQSRLLNRRNHLESLDAMAGLVGMREQTGAHWRAWRGCIERQQALREQSAAAQERASFVAFCIEELSAADVQEGETERLTERARKLHAAEELLEVAHACWEVIAAEGGARDQLASTQRRLERAAQHDEELQQLAERYEDTVTHLDELAHDLQRYADHVNLDPRALSEVQARLDTLLTLIRKYGGSEDALLERWRAYEHEAAQVESQGDELLALERDIPAKHAAALTAARQLSSARQSAAARVQKLVEEVIRALGMDRAEFHVSVEPQQEMTSEGLDRVRFLLASNPGEPPQPLEAVASGGELSRVLLGLKRATSATDPIATCVYDEVDAGLSGPTGVVLGRFLRELGARQQVLCISHLPQVAAAAHNHVWVHKRTESVDGTERTVSTALQLDAQGRKAQLATMLAGDQTDVEALNLAEELLIKQGGLGGASAHMHTTSPQVDARNLATSTAPSTSA